MLNALGLELHRPGVPENKNTQKRKGENKEKQAQARSEGGRKKQRRGKERAEQNRKKDR